VGIGIAMFLFLFLFLGSVCCVGKRCIFGNSDDQSNSLIFVLTFVYIPFVEFDLLTR
jgi:hypothetical protein